MRTSEYPVEVSELRKGDEFVTPDHQQQTITQIKKGKYPRSTFIKWSNGWCVLPNNMLVEIVMSRRQYTARFLQDRLY